MTWRDLELHPRLARRPRTDGGLPIPYITLWTGEREAGHMVVRPEPLCGRKLALFEPPGEGRGRAVFGAVSYARQRETVVQAKCQICRAPLGARAEWLLEFRQGRQTVSIEGRTVPMVIEPWLCEGCLVFSLYACPHLARMEGERPRLRRVEVARQVAVYSGRTRESLPWVGAKVPPQGVITDVKIALVEYETVDPIEFLSARGLAAPAGWS